MGPLPAEQMGGKGRRCSFKKKSYIHWEDTLLFVQMPVAVGIDWGEAKFRAKDLLLLENAPKSHSLLNILSN